MKFISGETHATGTTWVAMASLAAKSVDVLNATGTSLSFRRAGDTDAVFVLPTGIGYRFHVEANLAELEFKRTDDDNTQVTFYGDAQ